MQVPHIYALFVDIILPCTHLYGSALVSKVCQLTSHLPLASLQLMLGTYSHWIPSIARNAADGVDEALG